MRTAGRGAIRLNIVVILGLAGLFAVGLLYTLAERSPESSAEEFMLALARKDVDKVAEMSYLPNPSAPLRDQWDASLNNRARTFLFTWYWIGGQRPSQDSAAVRIIMWEFRGVTASEMEPVELPLVKHDGEWKVDLGAVTRSFFPGLPR